MKINLSLRNRIAFYFMTVTALFTVILFFVIYNIVNNTVYNHLDEDLEAEFSEVSKSIVVLNDELIFTNSYELEEQEHRQIEVNPTFIQIVDTAGNNIKRTSNLVGDNLIFNVNQKDKQFYDMQVGGSSVRQIQAPIKSLAGNIKAYLLIAIPLEESALVLSNLKYVLFVSYPIVLILLFSVSRIIAGKIISPINNIISTAEMITRENI
ncbi:MAG: sensor histidine kinase N-terminal domain-containing protein, partial [Ignavibacteriae bacterium]|nr:sensor histidine kinase N-terminal domain-containing protein [Ignavibacteriota bacterium]